MPTRRTAIAGAAALFGGIAAGGRGLAASGVDLGPPQAFDFDILTDIAKQAAAAPYQPPAIPEAELLEKIDYDAHWRIRYRDAASFGPEGGEPLVQLFHPGKYFREPVRAHVVEDGAAREVLFRRAYFTMPDDSPAQGLPEDVGFAGFRVMRPGLKPDWVSFLGASYFRTDGPFGQYGLSARGVAIDTGLAKPEEFPRFSHFWIGPPEEEGETVRVWALMDSPSLAGAYRFAMFRGEGGAGHRMDVSARLFFRRKVERLGVAPLTSMYWYSERDRIIADDWRPEIHDSDGLAMATGGGERIWRPLDNPTSVRTSSFLDKDPQGFGLVQRDRSFENYQDDGVFYDKRPTAWIEPQGYWGEGAVQLIEIPAHDETFDNIVAYWAPAATPEPGEERRYDYRINWVDGDPAPEGVARVAATRQGQGGAPGQEIPEGVDKMVIDFRGGLLGKLDVESGVEPVVTAARGRIVGKAYARPVVGTDRWRLSFDFAPEGGEPAEFRAFLRRDGVALTETWISPAVADRPQRGTP